jgi:protease I
MAGTLEGKNIAILMTTGVEQEEYDTCRKALEDQGAHVVVLGILEGEIRSWNEKNWGDTFKIDQPVKEAKPKDFHGLFLPGGVMNPDKLRQDEDAVWFVQSCFEHNIPIAAICHAPQILIETKYIHGRMLTSYPSVKTDIQNAGARWVDKEVVVDQGLVTSRSQDDLPAFVEKMLETFATHKPKT